MEMSSGPKLSEAARTLVVPDGIVKTDWPKVRKLASKLFGVTFDRWQDGLGMVMLGRLADGSWAASVNGVTISICRQAGKTFFISRLVFILCLLFPGMKALWTAHRTRTSDETFKSMVGLAGGKTVKRYVKRIRSANGQQEIEFSNGSRVLFGARERGFGRGFDGVWLEIYDEAQILTEAALDDMLPAMNTAPRSLVIMLGTPPKPGDPSEVFTVRRAEALSDPHGMVYVEFSADRSADLDDREQWAKANPSYPRRTPETSMLRLRRMLNDDSFRREALGVWDDVTVKSAIDIAKWNECGVDMPDKQGLIGYALDMPPARDSLAIGGAIRHKDGTAHIELREFKATQSAGTAWAVDWIVERWPKTAAVVIDDQSPAMSLLPDLKARHIKVIQTNAKDMGRACGRFQDMLNAGQLTHLSTGKQPALDTAVANATTRNIGSSGAIGWNKLGSDIDISPLVACTLALYGTFITKRRPGRVQKVMV